MFTHYISFLKMLFLKKRQSALLNTVGFAIGLTGFMLIALWVRHEISFEQVHRDSDRIYRALLLKSTPGEGVEKTPALPLMVGVALKADFPQVEDMAWIYHLDEEPLEFGQLAKTEGHQVNVSNNFFSFFSGFEFLEGDPRDVLKEGQNGVVITEKVKRALFGDAPALGKMVASNKYGQHKERIITGVVRIPQTTHFKFDIATFSIDSKDMLTSWGRDIDGSRKNVYIKLHPHAVITAPDKEAMADIVMKNTGRAEKLLFQPLRDIHLFSDYLYFWDQPVGSIQYVWIFIALGFLVLAMSMFNFSLLATAKASTRAKEIGVRKVAGARFPEIAGQFMLESFVQTLVAVVISLVLVFVLLPWFSAFTDKDFSAVLSWRIVPELLLLALIVGVVSGLYPAFYLNRLDPVRCLKGGGVTGSKLPFIRMLSLVQFAAAAFLLISTFWIQKQMNYIFTKDLGYDYRNLVIVPTGLFYGNGDLVRTLTTNPSIESVSAFSVPPTRKVYQTGYRMRWSGQASTDTLNAVYFSTDAAFADHFKLELLKGDYLKTTYDDYWNRGRSKPAEGEEAPLVSIPIVINETAWKAMGVDNPVGMRVNQNDVIIGVVKDFHLATLHQTIQPTVFSCNPEAISTLGIRIRGENREQTLQFIKEQYEKFRPERSFSYTFLEDDLKAMYAPERRQAKVFLLFSMLALSIALLGIIGLAAFSAGLRTREIGLRKVYGASPNRILQMINLDFLRWVFAGICVAIPVVVIVMQKWIASFAYQASPGIAIFLLAALLLLGVAAAVVSWQCYRVAAINPAEAMRNE